MRQRGREEAGSQGIHESNGIGWVRIAARPCAGCWNFVPRTKEGLVVKLVAALVIATAAVVAPLRSWFAAFFWVGGSDPILTIDNDTLTSYPLTSATALQDVRPRVTQRGVHTDGSLRVSPSYEMAIHGNPFGSPWSGENFGAVDLANGAPVIRDMDFALPSAGPDWVVGRSYNARQVDSGGSHRDSNGPQGYNWFQNSMPEIKIYEHASDDDKDRLYLVYGADAFIELARVDIVSGTSETFRAINGAAGVGVHTTGAGSEPDTFEFTDQHGMKYTFFWFDADSSPAIGQLWKIEDARGNKCYVGHATTGSSAISAGYTAEGYIALAFDQADRRYTYSYSTLDSVKRLTEVKAETKSGGTWASPTGLREQAKATYAYYTNESYGDPGDLKSVNVVIGCTCNPVYENWTTYYRYYEGSYDATSNPGYPHQVKLVMKPEGTRQFDYTDSTFDGDYTTESTESNLYPYTSARFKYDSNHKVKESTFNGGCGCGGGSDGTYAFTYATNGSYSDGSGYDTAWCSRVVIERPDSTNNGFVTQYFDETAQPLGRVLTDTDPSGSPTKTWAEKVTRDSNGCVTDIHTPENVTAYTHSTGSFTTSSSAGLVTVLSRESSGATKGFALTRKWKKGTSGAVGSGTASLDGRWTYTTLTKTISDADLVRPLVATSRDYATETETEGSHSAEWSWTYTAYSGGVHIEKIVTTEPVVSTGNNGSNSANSWSQYFSADGHLLWEKSPLGYITYHGYTNGLQTKLIRDADTTLTAGGQDFNGITIPTGFSSSGSPMHQKTSFTFDNQGRPESTTLPTGRVELTYHSLLADRRIVQLHFPRYVTGSPNTYYGPVGYRVQNQAGGTELSGTVSLTNNSSTVSQGTLIDETDADPITAVDALGAVAQMQTALFDETGHHAETQRSYFAIPATMPGNSTSHFDESTHEYDVMGRRTKTTDATGTIDRTTYEGLRGLVVERETGTDASGTGSDNMTTVAERVYDGGSAGKNGILTRSTAWIDGSSGDRHTDPTCDVRGRTLLVANPVAPHSFVKLDNMGRQLAVGAYSSTASITVGSDDPTSETTNRVGLSETAYDEMGRGWKSTRHKIDATDGSDDDTLDSKQWWDADGRLVKAQGSQLVKYRYDRLGRRTHQFILASTNDSAYADADDVSGDVVLEEHQTVYDGVKDNVLMTAVIQRTHDDVGGGQTTGELDTNADGDGLLYTAANLEGRIQITANWYDDWDRLLKSVDYGTYGGSNFDRDGLSAPSSPSDTELLSTYAYNTDRTRQSMTDSRGLVRKEDHDATGRVTKEIRNYNSGVNSGNPSGTDDNQTLQYTFSRGRMTQYKAVIDGSTNDQITTYAYGVTKGSGGNEISSNRLLASETYPDTGVVTYAYNAQGEVIKKTDQAGNVIETDYDVGGRTTTTTMSTIASGFDDRVERIVRSYSSAGLLQSVQQWDDTPSPDVCLDEIKYTHDGWLNLSKLEYDKNSLVGAGGSVDDYEISYAYSKATGGRQTVRRSSMTLPSGNVIDYTYSSSSSNDDAVSRLTELKDGAVSLVKYDYLGLGTVVGTTYDEPDVFCKRYAVSNNAYSNLDRYNRIVKDTWTKDLSSDVNFYDCDITWDRNGNITRIEDNVHAGFDVAYSVDDLDRITRAEEGTWNGSAITSRTRDQQWTLNHTGNWDREKLDLNGDGDFVDTDEHDDTRTHNTTNELLTRDLDSNSGTSGNNYSLDYDDVGNLVDDKTDYEYIYDPLGRLRKILKTSNQALVAEYYYDGLGQMVMRHEDTDADLDADGSDKKYWLVQDERWRWVGTFRESDASPKEEFVHHQAGLDGRGGSSYIDLVVLRDRDGDNAAWTTAADGTMEERIYYAQNRHADVSAIVTSGGVMVEWVKYSAYGVPFGLPRGDTDSDGDCDALDVANITGGYDVRKDIDLDGAITASDSSAATALSLGSASATGVMNGRQHSGSFRLVDERTKNHRHRALHTEHGRWLSRDQLGYVDGPSLVQYALSSPIALRDPFGQNSCGTCNVKCSPMILILIDGAAKCSSSCETTSNACAIMCTCDEYNDTFVTSPTGTWGLHITPDEGADFLAALIKKAADQLGLSMDEALNMAELWRFLTSTGKSLDNWQREIQKYDRKHLGFAKKVLEKVSGAVCGDTVPPVVNCTLVPSNPGTALPPEKKE